MRLTRLFEALDDKDEFTNTCMWPTCHFRHGDDVEEFHAAHMAATAVAFRKAINDDHYKDLFHGEMNKRGYFHRADSPSYASDWVKKLVKEDLDDKDTFELARCEYCEIVSHYDRSNIDFDEFHIAHTESEVLAKDNTGWFDDDTFISEMRKRGYEKQRYYQSYLWTKTSPLKESLDDKDQFEPESDCAICPQYRGEDLENFHNAHTNAHNVALRSHNYPDWWANYNKIFNDEMKKLGYVRAGEWVFAGEGGYTPWIRTN